MTDLNWFGWVLITLYVASTLLTVSEVDKPRKPIEHGAAVFIVLLNGLLIAGLLFVGTQG